MGVLMKQMELVPGKSKRETEVALVEISKQLAEMSELIKVRTDHEVWKLFQEQQQTMKKKESSITQRIK